MTQMATIKVKFRNAAKRTEKGSLTPASVRDENNVYWKFWTTGKNAVDLDSFEEGKTYTVGYHVVAGRNGNENFIDNVIEDTAPQANGHSNVVPLHAPAHAAGNGNGKDRSIYEQALIKEFIHAGKVPLDEDAIVMAIEIIQRAYDRTHK